MRPPDRAASASSGKASVVAAINSAHAGALHLSISAFHHGARGAFSEEEEEEEEEEEDAPRLSFSEENDDADATAVARGRRAEDLAIYRATEDLVAI